MSHNDGFPAGVSQSDIDEHFAPDEWDCETLCCSGSIYRTEHDSREHGCRFCDWGRDDRCLRCIEEHEHDCPMFEDEEAGYYFQRYAMAVAYGDDRDGRMAKAAKDLREQWRMDRISKKGKSHV